MPKPPETSSFKPVDLPKPQSTVARCVTVIDFGTIPTEYKGEHSMQRKLYIAWELPKLQGVFNEDRGPEPFTVGVEVTFSTADKANFSKLIAQWRNRPLNEKEKKEFDPIVMINKAGLVSFIHKRKAKYMGEDISKATSENTSMKFNGIGPLPEGLVCPPMISKPTKWDWDLITSGQIEFDKEKFEKLPKWIQAKMITSDEFKKYAKGFDQAAEEDVPDVDHEEEKIEKDDNGGW